jgi:hypothetical protein
MKELAKKAEIEKIKNNYNSLPVSYKKIKGQRLKIITAIWTRLKLSSN